MNDELLQLILKVLVKAMEEGQDHIRDNQIYLLKEYGYTIRETPFGIYWSHAE